MNIPIWSCAIASFALPLQDSTSFKLDIDDVVEQIVIVIFFPDTRDQLNLACRKEMIAKLKKLHD
jgi:hypothetical protein